MNTLGSEQKPLRVAIVGSGPSAFYATEALIKSGHTVRIDMLERLPAPFGLVRNGVAPDHPKLKQPILIYDKIARSPAFTFLGNVTVGHDIRVAELQSAYHAVIFACGAETDRKLGIAGEDLPGSYTATEFVGWYNGHPDYRDRVFDLSQEVAVIIGQGNVAADVCRILSKTVDELKHTDIAEHALAVLAESKVREVHVIGRRGPAQAKFTNKELRELGELADCDAVVDPADLCLNRESELELADKANFINANNVEIFKTWASRPTSGKRRRCYFRFLESPVMLLGQSHLERLVLERNKNVIPTLYVTGWIKRGPSGVIGTNRADSVATVNALLADLPKLDSAAPKAGAEALYPLLTSRGGRVVSYGNWLKIDAVEVERGKPKGKPREKLTTVEEMLAVGGLTKGKKPS